MYNDVCVSDKSGFRGFAVSLHDSVIEWSSQYIGA